MPKRLITLRLCDKKSQLFENTPYFDIKTFQNLIFNLDQTQKPLFVVVGYYLKSSLDSYQFNKNVNRFPPAVSIAFLSHIELPV